MVAKLMGVVEGLMSATFIDDGDHCVILCLWYKLHVQYYSSFGA